MRALRLSRSRSPSSSPPLSLSLALCFSLALALASANARPARAQTASPQHEIALLPAPYNGANYEAGRSAFDDQCASCHAIAGQSDPDALGPDLDAILGRPAGSVPGFAYSTALRQARFAWDASRLDAWLRHPAGVVPGNAMLFDGVGDDAQRRDIIAYLMIAGR